MEMIKLKRVNPLARSGYGRISMVYETISGVKARLAICISSANYGR
jgi:hypothetical protein